MGRLKTGVGHDGRSRAFARKGEATLATHHDPQAARAGDKGIAPAFMKPAASKALHPVALHNSATPRQISGAGKGGMGHAVNSGGEVIGTSAAAVPHAYGTGIPKRREAAQPVWSQRSRTNEGDKVSPKELGAAIFAEALAASASTKTKSAPRPMRPRSSLRSPVERRSRAPSSAPESANNKFRRRAPAPSPRPINTKK